jgi:hypothetical protein
MTTIQNLYKLLAHSLHAHRWHYQRPGNRVCRTCHLAQGYVRGEWRALGVVVGWEEE